MTYKEPTSSTLSHNGTSTSAVAEWKAGNKRKSDGVIAGMVNNDTLNTSLYYEDGSGWLSVTLSSISGDITAKNINIKTASPNTTNSDRKCRIYLKNSKNTSTKYIVVTQVPSGGSTENILYTYKILVEGLPDITLSIYSSDLDLMLFYTINFNAAIYIYYAFEYIASTGEFNLLRLNDEFDISSIDLTDYDQVYNKMEDIYSHYNGDPYYITYEIDLHDRSYIPIGCAQLLTVTKLTGWNTGAPRISSYTYEHDSTNRTYTFYIKY